MAKTVRVRIENSNLVEHAKRLGNHRTGRAAVDEALRRFIEVRQRLSKGRPQAKEK